MARAILHVSHINRGYGSNVYKVCWRGEYKADEIINIIDPGNYGGFIDIKRRIQNVTTAIVTVYTD